MKIAAAITTLLLLAACDSAPNTHSAEEQMAKNPKLRAIAEIGASQQHILGSWKKTGNNPLNSGESTTMKFDPYQMGAQWGVVEYGGQAAPSKTNWQLVMPGVIVLKNDSQKTKETCKITIQENKMVMNCENEKPLHLTKI